MRAAVGLALVAAVATVLAWPQLEFLSATSVSYTSQVNHRENIAIDAYDTVTSVRFFSETSGRLTRGVASDDGRLDALMRWTNENVRPQYGSPGRVVTDDSWELARRGFGQCDQVNHIFATLATYAGYDARELFLWTTVERTTSPHAVAEVLVGGRWVVVDAWQGVVWRGADGRLLTRQEATPALMQRFGYTQWGIQAEWFKNGTEFRTFPYESPLAFLQKFVHKVGTLPAAPPVVAPVVQANAPTASPATSSGQTATAKPASTVPQRTAGQALLVEYDSARRSQLGGNYAAAVAGYRSVLARNPVPELADSARFWMGLAQLREGKPREALDTFDAALTADPGTPWRGSVLQYRAEARSQLGDRAGSVADDEAAGTPASRERLEEQGFEVPAAATP